MMLATLVGSTVAIAATTHAWEAAASHEFAELPGHGDPAKTKLLGQRWTGPHEQLMGVAGTDLEPALAAKWVTLLIGLLEEDPAVEPDLRAPVEEMHVMLPSGVAFSTSHGPWRRGIDHWRG